MKLNIHEYLNKVVSGPCSQQSGSCLVVFEGTNAAAVHASYAHQFFKTKLIQPIISPS